MKSSIRAVLLAAVLALWIGAPATAVAEVEATLTADQQARFDALTHEFRCMQCQNTSIADSAVGLAADLRRDVREQIAAGKTDAQIRDSMVKRYGNIILFRPPFEKSTAWVWIAPFVLLLVGAFVAFRIVRQRSSMVAGDDSLVDADERAP